MESYLFQEKSTKKAILRPWRQESDLNFMNKDDCIDKRCTRRVWLKKELISKNDKILVSDIIPYAFHYPQATLLR